MNPQAQQPNTNLFQNMSNPPMQNSAFFPQPQSQQQVIFYVIY